MAALPKSGRDSLNDAGKRRLVQTPVADDQAAEVDALDAQWRQRRNPHPLAAQPVRDVGIVQLRRKAENDMHAGLDAVHPELG